MKWVSPGVWLATALAFNARPLRAESAPDTERVKFTWHDTTPTKCLEPRALAERIEHELGRPVFVRVGAPPATVELKVEVLAEPPDAIELQLELSRDGERLGSRTLRGSTEHCAALFESSVVVMALLVDAPREGEAGHLPSPSFSVRAASVAPQTPRSAEPRRAVTELELGAHAISHSGLLPDSAWGLGLDARLKLPVWPWFGLRLAGAYFPRTELVTEAGTAELSAGALSVGLSPVRFRTGARFRIEPWLFLGANGVSAQGQGFSQNHQGTRWIPTAGVGLAGELQLTAHWALSAEAIAGLALARPSFLYQNQDGNPRELYRVARLLPGLQLGLIWKFL